MPIPERASRAWRIDEVRVPAYANGMVVTNHRGRSPKEYCLFAVAWLGLALAAVTVRILPFRLICRWMERPARKLLPGVSSDEVALAVNRAAVRTPWRSVCIQQGMVGHRLLRLAGHCSQFVYGISTSSDPLEAHVWVRVGNRVVLGGEPVDGFQEIMALPR